MTDIPSASSRQQLIQQALLQVGNTRKTAPTRTVAQVQVQRTQQVQVQRTREDRPSFFKSADSPENKQNLSRFRQIMNSDEALHETAPRGFYLNIKV